MVCSTACVDGLIRWTVLSPALSTQIAPPPATTAVGLVPTGTDATTWPFSSSSLTALAGTAAAATGASARGSVAPPASAATATATTVRALSRVRRARERAPEPVSRRGPARARESVTGAGAAATQSRVGSCRSILVLSSCRGGLGSMPSSVSSTERRSRYAARASDCRPER